MHTPSAASALYEPHAVRMIESRSRGQEALDSVKLTAVRRSQWKRSNQRQAVRLRLCGLLVNVGPCTKTKKGKAQTATGGPKTSMIAQRKGHTVF
jgi:hypothetical protein